MTGTTVRTLSVRSPLKAKSVMQPAAGWNLPTLRYGLHAKSAVLPGEDAGERERLEADLIDTLEPVGALEVALVLDIAAEQWLLARYAAAEAGLLADNMPAPDPYTDDEPEELARDIGRAFQKAESTLATCSKLRTSAVMRLQRLRRQLSEVQAERQGRAVVEAAQVQLRIERASEPPEADE